MRGMSKKDALACQVSLGLFAGLLGIASTAHGAPIADGGGVKEDGVRTGGAKIVQSGVTTNITSDNTNNVIGWKDFSVKNGETVQFDNGAKTNNYLNIVTGNVTSQIAGKMEGGKNVYIANPHGVVFDDGASVNVGNLYVTTRKLDANVIGTAVGNGTIDLDTPTSAGVTGNIINGSAASSAGLAESDIVSLVDSTGSVKANKIVMEGKSVRIINGAKIDSSDVYTVADQSSLTVNAGTVRSYKGYVHIGYDASKPTTGTSGKYKSLTDANLYKLIANDTQLNAMALDDATANYMLRNDIALPSTHAPIGTEAQPFKGRFDGMFHEIKNMKPNGPGSPSQYVGLFGTTDGATIMNVGLKEADLSAVSHGGGLVGHAKGKTVISTVYNESTKKIGTGPQAGGIIGTMGEASLDNAYNTAPVENGGGIIGQLNGSSKIYAVYNTGTTVSGTSSGIYQDLGSSFTSDAFIKDAYTTNGDLMPPTNNNIVKNSYVINSGTATLVRPTSATGSAQTGDAKQAATYDGWDISDEGGANKTWRVFADHFTPLLTAFMQGTVQAEYSYADFTRPNKDNKSTYAANTYTDMIAGTLKKNGGKSMPEDRTYDATYRTLTKEDRTKVGGISDITVVGYTAPASTSDPKAIQINTDGRRNAGKEALLYSGQHGYDVAGANVKIKKRKVIGDVANITIEREYDGTADAGDAFQKAITGNANALRTEGLVAGDDAEVSFTSNKAVTFREGWASTDAESPNAGYGKSVYVDSSKVQFKVAGTVEATGGANYEFDATTINKKKLTGNIRQKKLVVGLDDTKDYSKTYDSTSFVKSTVDPKTTNNVLTLAPKTSGGFATGDVLLNYSDITANYMTGKTASDKETSNAGTNRDIAYKNIKLAVGSTGSTANYMLVNAAGDVLYREALANEPAAMTQDTNKNNERYIGPATTAGGTLWGKGDIKKRNIATDTFLWDNSGTVSKVYDGTSDLDNSANQTITAKKASDSTVNTDEGVIDGDLVKINFALVGKGKFKKSDGTTDTANVSEAAKASYKLTASNVKPNEDVLQNYTIGGAEISAAGHDVTGAGKITPRTITLDLLKKTGVNKTYDGTTDVPAADKVFGTNFGYAEGTAAENQLVPGDGSSITATAAAYATKTVHTERAQDVYRGTAALGEAESNGKNVVYTIGLAGTNADTNYVLSYTPTGGTATTGSSVTMTGTGAITPKKLTPRFTAVSRAYNGRSDAAASLLKDNYTLDKVGSDDVTLNTNTDTTTPPVSTITGRYYQDATGTTPVSKAGSGYTVKYTGFAAALTGAQRDNYTIADTFDVRGSITKAALDPSSFVMRLGAKVEKTYDGTALAPNNGLTQVKVGSETINQGSDYRIDRGSSKYYMGTPETEQRDANADENGNLLSSGNRYGVQYTIELQGDAKDNYDLSGLNNKPNNDGTGTYTVDSSAGKISFTKNDIGYIKARKIYVSLDEAVKGTNARNTPTKVYDGTDRLIREGASTGEFIVKFSGGSGAEPAGLAKVNGADVGKNDSIAAYENRNAGDPDRGYLRNVVYTPRVSGVASTNYVFYHEEGAYQGQKVDAAHPLTGRGTITQADLLVTAPTDVRRPYNGDTDVASGQGKLLLATPKKHESAAGKNDVDTAGVLDNVALNEIDESKAGTVDASKYYRSYRAKDANANDTASQSQYVTYRRIQLTGTDAVNYRLVYRGADSNLHALERDTMTGSDGKATYTMMGSGIIDRRRVNEGDFLLDFKDVTKRYDGTKDVKKDNDTARANEYISEVSVNLGGTVGKDHFTFGTGGYTLDAEKTQYADANVVNNTGTGKVTYTLNLSKNLLKNYDFSDLNKPAGQAAGYSYNSATNAVSRTLEVGTITKRPVYAHVVNDNVTKTYNAKKDVVDESGSPLTGEQLVRFDNIKNGVVDAEAGLVSADSVGNNKVGNNTRAQYTDKNFGDRNRTINYTLAFSGNDPARFNNYELQDGNGNATTTLTTTTNTINRRALKLKANPVTKVYDATKTVKVGGTPSTTGVGLAFVGGDLQTDESNVQDVVNLGNAYTREYDSPNATRSEASKKNNVTYSGVKLVAGGAAANYFLADADGTALTGNDTAGYTMKGDGVINPLTVKKDNLKMTFRTAPISKTYDGTAYVDGDTENPAAWRSYITDSYVTDDSNNRLFNIAIDKVNSATYRTGVAAGSDGTADKNAADGKKVLFNIKFSDADQNNFEFDSDFYSGSAGTDRMLRGDDGSSTYNVYTTGDIKKRILTAALGQTSNIRKVYDGGLEADKNNLRVNNFLEGDKDQLDTSAVFDRSNANVSPGETVNARTITYTATLTGDAVGNYAFDSLTGSAQKVLTATGDIEKRKVYARVTAPRVKTYDATTKVLIDGADPISSDALVTLGRNNSNDANTGLVDGKGANKTTAVYAGANAADASDSPNKQVDYKLAIDGSDAYGAFADNYIVYDESGNVVYNTATGRDTLTTYDNTINRAPLSVTAKSATKEYDGGRKVKNPSPERLLNITGGWQGSDSGDLNRSGTDSYTTTYLDENVNDKGVDYGNVKIVGEGTTKASNYYLAYDNDKDKEIERNGETYRLHGEGAITKRILTGNDLHAGFTTTPIKKTYDGTTDVKDPAQYVQYMRTRYKKDDGTDLDLAANGYTVERADYLDKADGTEVKVKAKDVATGKDVKFQFALNDGNFDYTGLAGWQPDANGVYHFSENYGRDKVTNPDGSISETGRGEITGRNVGVTLHLVQKLYDGTTGVKNGYYTRDANGNLIEHKNSDVDWKQVFTLNGTHGEIAGDANSGFANGETFDFDASGSYGDKTVNRGPQYTNDAKDVDYRVKLKQDSANRNYTFQYRVVDADGKELAATDTAQTVRDAKGNPTGHTFHGKGDIWQKRLTLHAEGIDRDYNGKAELTPEQRRALTFDGVAQTDSAAFNFSNPNDARAAGFVDRIHGRYGDRSADAFTANAHVKRPADNINGKPEARDVEFMGVKDAFESLLQRGDVANNYFYDGDNTVYGTGTIKPLTRTLQKTWQKGAAFEKMYDGDARAMIGGKHAWESAEAKQAFHDKLRLSVDLGTGEAPIELDYSLYGDAAGDIGEPHYENFSGRTAHHGQDDANVRNSADPNDTLEKDIVYRLKSVDGDKAWQKDPNAPKYKDWELSESPVGKEVRLSDADVDNSAGLKAYITPRAITLKADEYSKIYDGTAGVAAPSLSADALAEKERELRSKLHVTDDKTRELLGRDGVDFTVDAAQSQFLGKSTYRPDADVARDAAGNVPQDGKLVEYKLSKTGGVIEQGNYVLPTGTQTDAFLGAGSITPRTVRVRFNPTDTATPDKIYDGTQYTVKDGKLFSRTFELVPQGVDEGIVATDRGGVRLNKTANIGRFASPNVQKENGGVQDVFYNDGLELTNDTGKAANYTLESRNLRDTARITPRPLDIYLKDGDIRKEYDGTTNVADKFQAANNIALVDRNRDVEGIAKPALPTWNAGDAATYDSKDAVNRTVFYNPSWTDGNFVLQKGQKTVNPTNPNDPTLGLAEIRRLEYTAVDSDGRPQMKDGVYGTRIEADGVIDRRKIKIDAAKDADKIYDGKANVLNPLGNLSFKYNGANAEQNEANGLVEGEGDAVKAALRVQGVYRSNDDSAADANAADSDAQDYKKHPVRYTFEKDEARDPVLANYEIATDAGGNTVLGTGIIERRTLNVRPDRQATYTGKGNVNYTGRVEDGSAAVNGNSPLTPEVEAELRDLNRKIFYGPAAGADYRTPGQTDIYGWYLRDDGTPARASGRYDTNYTFDLQATKLSIAPRVDSVVPERTIRPDSKVYERAAFDESNVFGKNKDLDAALAYTGEGVNIGGMKPQQGTSTNASDVGIRQQGTGTNIGSSAGIGGTAGVNGKVQGATSAVNEAARAAGAQPGAAVKPQGTTGGNAALAGGAAGSGGYYSPSAQSGASVKAQGTTGGNAALAGGTADLGGYYSPGAQPGASVKPQGTTGGNAALAGGTAGLGGYYSPGASVKPQGAKSGAAGKPQGAASAVGSAGSTVGAGSVVDRGLAAAAGMSVGSSSDARTGASGSRRSADYSSGAGSYADGSSRAADRGLANALGKGVGSAGYYSGKGYSHTNDDEEEEIKKKTKASA